MEICFQKYNNKFLEHNSLRIPTSFNHPRRWQFLFHRTYDPGDRDPTPFLPLSPIDRIQEKDYHLFRTTYPILPILHPFQPQQTAPSVANRHQ
jgi:hypothetical protein